MNLGPMRPSGQNLIAVEDPEPLTNQRLTPNDPFPVTLWEHHGTAVRSTRNLPQMQPRLRLPSLLGRPRAYGH